MNERIGVSERSLSFNELLTMKHDHLAMKHERHHHDYEINHSHSLEPP